MFQKVNRAKVLVFTCAGESESVSSVILRKEGGRGGKRKVRERKRKGRARKRKEERK